MTDPLIKIDYSMPMDQQFDNFGARLALSSYSLLETSDGKQERCSAVEKDLTKRIDVSACASITDPLKKWECRMDAYQAAGCKVTPWKPVVAVSPPAVPAETPAAAPAAPVTPAAAPVPLL
jgi:hypothetical protein